MKRQFNQRGSTLIDICAACMMGSVTMALALPSYQGFLERTSRGDAVSALEHVHAVQAEHLAKHGRFAVRLSDLGRRLPASSERGLYSITMFADGPHSYEVRASAVRDRELAKDPDCAQITLRVTNAVIAYEPSARCWNR